MWIRSDLKERAKNILRVSYWQAFLVSLVVAFVGGSGGGFNFGIPRDGFGNQQNGPNIGGGDSSSPLNFPSPELFTMISIFIVIFIGIMLVSVAFKVFLCFPLEVCSRKYFTRASENEVNLNYIGFCFKSERYMDIVFDKASKSRNNGLDKGV